MIIKPSDLFQRLDNSNFTIFVDPFENEWFYNKKLKHIQKMGGNGINQIYDCESKIDAKRKIIELIS